MRDGEKRTARMDLRLTPTERKIAEDVAKAKRRTISSLFAEWIETLQKGTPK